MSLDIESEILEEEFDEELEKIIGIDKMNQIRRECDEPELICKENYNGSHS